MTRTTYDSGGTALPEGERLHEAFAEELDRPGLEGPSFDAVLRSGTARLRRRRVTVGATFAVASVAAVATAALAAGGTATRGVDSAASGAGVGSPAANAAVGTTLSAPGGGSATTPARASTSAGVPAPASAPAPADAVLASGSVNGHAWQLVRKYTLDRPMSNAPSKGSTPLWCGNLDVIVDGVQTNAGSGNSPCLNPNGTPQVPANPADPGFASIVIIDAHHDRLGTLVTGSVSPLIASVGAQCASQSLTAKTSQPAGDTSAYYSFVLPNGSGCQLGSLSFFDASGSRTASLTGVGFEGGK